MHLFLLECAAPDAIDLRATLIPLEGVKSLRQVWTKTILDIVVHPEIALNKINKVFNDFVGILVKQSLKFGHLFVIIEVLFILRV